MTKNVLFLVHQKEEKQILLTWQRGQENPRVAPPVSLPSPLSAEEREELRWYLEDYLAFPYGAMEQRAARVQDWMRDWGQALFEAIFQGSQKAQQFYQEAVREGLDQCEIGVQAEDPDVLNLPWELLYDPDRRFLAPLLAGMYRTRSGQRVGAPLPDLPQDTLNILLVICRPYGDRDISLRTIAGPLLRALAPIRDRVYLKVLRPPTFDQFQQELNQRKGFYHIVHFDGHGTFDPTSRGMRTRYAEGEGQGVLVFETATGKDKAVPASVLGQSLADCRVPLFVLNACKSAQEGGSDPFSSVASQLIALGAKGVVAMGYSVYAEAAERFVGRLYEELAQGSGVSQAVAAARRKLLAEPERHGPKGMLRLEDWPVPVLYQQEPYAPFRAAPPRKRGEELIAPADRPTRESPSLVDLKPEGAYGFVGRDYDLLRLERAFQGNRVVLLQGMAGVGKTELACGFARWLTDTEGRDGGISFFSFEGGGGLEAVVHPIGVALGGDAFQRLPTREEQEAVVLDYLKRNPALLIWDNFEPVNGFPEGNPPLLEEAARAKLAGFLRALRDGKSWVLITSRREEPWLDVGYHLLDLKGLNQADAVALAGRILEQAGVDPGALGPEYLDLLRMLGGHPLALRVVLPNLRRHSAAELIRALQEGLDTLAPTDEEEGRDRSLTVSLDYSFAQMSERARRHLPLLGLFAERVGAHVLAALSSDAMDASFGETYAVLFGETLSEEDWVDILEEAARAGIVERLGGHIYTLHPALPWHLRRQLTKSCSPEQVGQLEEMLIRLYAGLGDFLGEQFSRNPQGAVTATLLEEPNLLLALRRAETRRRWAEVQAILQPLGELYELRSRLAEFRRLRERLLAAVGEELAVAREQGAADLWMYLRGVDATDALARNDLAAAEAIYRLILADLQALNDPAVENKIGVVYHQLGRVAQERREWQEAEDWYRKALEIRERLPDESRAASDYHQLGTVAQERREWPEAEDWYRKALEIRERLGDESHAANDYHNLGIVAQQRRQWQEAEDWYRKALEIRERLGDESGVAGEYHHLGFVAQVRGQWPEAEDWYRKAVQIDERLQDELHAADEYHHLGIVAQQRRQWQEAEDWYNKAREIYERLRMELDAADEYHHLGTVAHARERWQEAEGWYKKAREVYGRLRAPEREVMTLGLWGLLKRERGDHEGACPLLIRAFGLSLQHQLEDRLAFDAILGSLLSELGEKRFREIWREETGKALPPKLLAFFREAHRRLEEQEKASD